MKRIALFGCVFIMFLSIGGNAPGPGGLRFERLYTTGVGRKGGELVISRSNALDRAIFNFENDQEVPGPDGKSLFARTESIREVRAELVLKDAPPVLLGAFLNAQSFGPPAGGVIIFDSAQIPEGFIVAMATGTQLKLWRIGVFGPSNSAITPLPNDWTQLAVPYAPDREAVTMKIGIRADGLAEVTVVEKKSGATTLFRQQNPGGFDFRKAKPEK